MSWRGNDPAVKAARSGHNAVLATVGKLYFDWYQTNENKQNEPLAWGGHTTLEAVYRYRFEAPMDATLPGGVPSDKAHHILGAQGQLWTEYMPHSRQVEYMAFPRATALAEIVWLKQQPKQPKGEEDTMRTRDYEDFYQRLVEGHLPRLDALNVNYRRPKSIHER